MGVVISRRRQSVNLEARDGCILERFEVLDFVVAVIERLWEEKSRAGKLINTPTVNNDTRKGSKTDVSTDSWIPIPDMGF